MDECTAPVADAIFNLKRRFSRLYFIVVKLPLMLFAIVLGFILDTVFALPFLLLLFLNYRATPSKKGPPV